MITATYSNSKDITAKALAAQHRNDAYWHGFDLCCQGKDHTVCSNRDELRGYWDAADAKAACDAVDTPHYTDEWCGSQVRMDNALAVRESIGAW